jgi:glycosyltransferase involved in cell wall biosynthesis
MPERVSVVITTYNHARFLGQAIESVLEQTTRPLEIIVVDDGSSDRPDLVTAGYPSVRLIRQENQGLAAARNTGWRASTGAFVVFLDADDRLLPEALTINLATFASDPRCGFVYAAYRMIDEAGLPVSSTHLRGAGEDPYAALLRGNCVGMHATVMYPRDRLEAVGGFDAGLRACEDYDLYLRLARRFPVAWAEACIAEYRIHHANMSHDAPMMLEAALKVLRRQETFARKREDWSLAYDEGVAHWRSFYAPEYSGGRADNSAIAGIGVQLAKAIVDWRGAAHRDAGFPLVVQLGSDRSTLLVHPLPDLATAARVMGTVPVGLWEVHADCVLLDQRAPPVAFRLGVDLGEGGQAFSPWVELLSATDRRHLQMVLPPLSVGPGDLLLQTRLVRPETADYAHAAFRDVILRPYTDFATGAGMLQAACLLKDYSSDFPLYLFDPAKGAFHHPLPDAEVIAVLGPPLRGAKRVTARASVMSEQSPAVDCALAVVPAGWLAGHDALGEHGDGSLAFSGWQTIEPLGEGDVSVELPNAAGDVLVASVRPGPSGETDYALFFWRSIAFS